MNNTHGIFLFFYFLNHHMGGQTKGNGMGVISTTMDGCWGFFFLLYFFNLNFISHGCCEREPWLLV